MQVDKVKTVQRGAQKGKVLAGHVSFGESLIQPCEKGSEYGPPRNPNARVP